MNKPMNGLQARAVKRILAFFRNHIISYDPSKYEITHEEAPIDGCPLWSVSVRVRRTDCDPYSPRAVICGDGRFFAFSAAIAEFVDGFASQGHVPLFGYLLHWMDLLQNQRHLEASAIQRLHKLFEENGSNWRNAGAFAATLSTEQTTAA